MLATHHPLKRSLFTLLAIALVVGCGLTGCSSQGGDATGNSTSALFSNDGAAFSYFVARGLTPVQAAGIVGNLDQESGVDPNAIQQGGPGRGIAQWSTGGRWDSDGGDNALAYANQHGQSVWSFQLQLEFIWYELTSFPGYGLAQLKAATTVAQATVAFEKSFEGCGICAESQRIAFATAVLNAYGNVNASGCTPQQVTDAAKFGCACVDGQGSGGFCNGTGCTAEETTNAGDFGCACVDGKASGGFCAGTGCTAKETNDAAKFGCACVDHQGDGGFCPGTGCTAKETNDAAQFGCTCVDHKANGGFCPGTGCTEKETNDAAKFGCGCVDHKANGGACPGSGCTEKETNDCKSKGKTCSLHACK